LRTLDHEALRRGHAVPFAAIARALKQPQILEVGCANRWLCEKLVECDEVTGVDVAEAAISDAKSRVPNVTFFAADFCSLDLPPARFDVALALEIFSHVPDQRGFVRQLAAVLKPRGHLILLTQNRLIYSRRSDIAPQGVGQVRCWVTMRQLRALVAPHFDVLRAFTMGPSGHLGFLRMVNSAKLNAALSRVIPHSKIDRLKERAGLGQTLVMLAQRRVERETVRKG